MATMTDLRARMRRDLRDDDLTSARWTDAMLTRFLERAIRDYSEAAPREMRTTVTTTVGSREIAIGALPDLIDVEAVEWPVGRFPTEYAPFQRWHTTLTLLTARPGDGSPAVMYWLAMHPLDASTIPVADEELIVRGACAFAALEQASFSINRLNLTGDDTSAQHLHWGKTALAEWRDGLRRLRRRVRTRRLFLPAGPIPTQTTDIGPQ